MKIGEGQFLFCVDLTWNDPIVTWLLLQSLPQRVVFTTKGHIVLHTPQWYGFSMGSPWDNEIIFHRFSYMIDKQCLEQWLLSNGHGN